MSATKVMSAVAVLAVSVAVGGATYWAGKSTEEKFRGIPAQMSVYGVKVKIVDYQRGFLGATATTEWSAPGDDESMVSFKHTIKHGPLATPTAIASVHSELILSEDITASLAEAFGENPFKEKSPISLDMKLGWGGGWGVGVHSPSFETVGEGDGQGKRFSWGGVAGHFDIAPGFAKVKGKAVMNGLSADGLRAGKPFKLQMGAVTLQGDTAQAKGYGGVSTGEGSLLLDSYSWRSLTGNGDEETTVSLEKLGLGSKQTVNDGAMGLTIQFSADTLAVTGATPISVEKPGFALQFDNIDAKALETVQAAFRQDGGKGGAALFATLQEQFEVILKRNPSIALKDIRARWPEGMTEGSLVVAYQGSGAITGLTADDVAADLQFSLPRALVVRLADGEGDETNNSINESVQGGFLVEKDGILSINASYKKGELTINGHPQPTDVLKGLLGF